MTSDLQSPAVTRLVACCRVLHLSCRKRENGAGEETRTHTLPFQVPPSQQETISDFRTVSRIVSQSGFPIGSAAFRPRCTGVTVPAFPPALAGQNENFEGVPPSSTLTGQCCERPAADPRAVPGEAGEAGPPGLTLYYMEQFFPNLLHPKPCRQLLSRVDKPTETAFFQHRFLLSVRRDTASTKTHKPGYPVRGGTHVEMTNAWPVACRCRQFTLNHGIVMPESKPAEVQHLLTLDEAAERLTVSRRTLERLIEEWKFPHPVKINRSSRVLRSDLDSYIAKIATQRPTG